MRGLTSSYLGDLSCPLHKILSYGSNDFKMSCLRRLQTQSRLLKYLLFALCFIRLCKALGYTIPCWKNQLVLLL